ncbi:hypothetical protein SAV14893_089090 [Streptomyces avermitilis]|uniref:PAS domain-containing protein n=1 Tax=Streptomyces avermitilis TaxID=33903 RepID=A0A4D4MCH6_STRAX|nr:hypothetical protein SAV14893_089090 [Streptomyces avermitilis]
MDKENAKNAYSAGASQGSTGVSGSGPGGRRCACDGPAAAVLDDRGAVVGWTETAEDLTGFRAGEVCGRPVQELVADLPDHLRGATDMPESGRVRLRHQCGDTIDVTFRTTRVQGSAQVLVLAAPTHHVADHKQGTALLRALSAQNRITIALYDTDLATVQTNAKPDTPDGLPVQPGTRLSDVLCADDAENLEAVLRQVLETGVPVVRRTQQVSWRHNSARRHTLSLSAFRLEDVRARPTGVAALYIDSDDLRARRHLDLAREVAERVGGSLDVVRTAQDLADVLAPAFGDLAAVDLAYSVLDGEEPSKQLNGGNMGNAALAPATAVWPAGIKRGESIPPLPDHPLWRSFRHGEPAVFSLDDFIAMVGDPQLVKYLAPKDAHSMMVAPLHARGLTLGAISVWRCGRSDPFTEDEADLMKQIASRGALAIDNARRYTREHRAAVALQQLLLPRPPPTRRPPRPPASTCPQAGKRTSAATGTTPSLCPLSGWHLSPETWSATACPQAPPWAACAPPSGRSRTWSSNRTSCSPGSRTWSSASRPKPRPATATSSAERACTRSTTRSPAAAPWPAPGIRHPSWCGPTGPPKQSVSPRGHHSP